MVIELTGAHNRYHCPLARTVSLGKPHKELDYVAKATPKAEQRPRGDQAGSGDPRTRLHLELDPRQVRPREASRLGYSIGIGYPPDWGGERTISIRTEDETVLETNMTFHIVCGMWMDNYGFELSESVRVSPPTGVECFTSFPRELIQK